MTVYWSPSANTYNDGATDYVEEKKASHPNFATLPAEAQEISIRVWKAEAPKDDSETVAVNVDSVILATSRAREATKVAESASSAKRALTVEILRGWTLADATEVVGKKTIAASGSTLAKTVDLSALEQLRDAAGLLGWPTLLGWIATKRDGAATKVKDTTSVDWSANDGIDADLLRHVFKLAVA